MYAGLLVAVAMAGTAVPAQAGVQAPGSTFDCRAGAGRHHSSILGSVATAGSVAGILSVSRMSMHAKYLTFGGAMFVAADDSWQARLEVVGSSRFRRNILAARLRILRDGKEQVLSLGDLGLDKPVTFQLTLAEGKVKAMLGNKTAEAGVPISASTARVVCSTGDVQFTKLRFTA